MYNPTRVHFGKGVVAGLGNTVSGYGRQVLLVYGKGSIKANGIYDQVMGQLQAVGSVVHEYSGIKSNPLVEDVDLAAELGREKGVDVIVAVGGGSVIDSAKVISITIPADHGAWEFMEGRRKPRAAVPLISVLTLAATGTEMNKFAVIQDTANHRKLGYGHDLIYPRHSFLDPAYTLSVNAGYTAYGIADLMAHAMELWFGEGDAPLSDRFILAIMQEALEAGPLLMKELGNYELRARIMYAATSALNGFTAYGKAKGDWGVHSFGHVLSVMYDVPHGASLSIVYPAWLKLMQERIPERVGALMKGLFGTDDSSEGIARLEAFLLELGCPVRLADHYAGDWDKEAVVAVMERNASNGAVHKLSAEDYRLLVDLYFS